LHFQIQLFRAAWNELVPHPRQQVEILKMSSGPSCLIFQPPSSPLRWLIERFRFDFGSPQYQER